MKNKKYYRSDILILFFFGQYILLKNVRYSEIEEKMLHLPSCDHTKNGFFFQDKRCYTMIKNIKKYI